MSENNEEAVKKSSFIQTIRKRDEDGTGPSLETKLGFKQKFKGCSSTPVNQISMVYE